MAEIIWSDYVKKSIKQTIGFFENKSGSEIIEYLMDVFDQRINQVVLISKLEL